MIVAGIDVGGKNVHIVIKKDGQIIGKGAAPTGIKKAETVEALYDQVLKQAGLMRKDVERVVATRIKKGFGVRLAILRFKKLPSATTSLHRMT